MIVPRENLRSVRVPASAFLRGHKRAVFLSLAGVVAAGSIAWVLWVNHQIHAWAHRDEARPADAIAVFGAA